MAMDDAGCVTAAIALTRPELMGLLAAVRGVLAAVGAAMAPCPESGPVPLAAVA